MFHVPINFWLNSSTNFATRGGAQTENKKGAKTENKTKKFLILIYYSDLYKVHLKENDDIPRFYFGCSPACHAFCHVHLLAEGYLVLCTVFFRVKIVHLATI